MADGSVIIDTGLDNSGIEMDAKEVESRVKSLCSSVEKFGSSLQKSAKGYASNIGEILSKEYASGIEGAKAKLEDLANAKIPTDEYKKVCDEIEKVNASLDKLNEKQDKLKSTGADQPTAKWQENQKAIEEATAALERYKQVLQEAQEWKAELTSGNAEDEAISGGPEAYAEYKASVAAVNEEIAQNIEWIKQTEASLDQLIAKQEQLKAAGADQGSAQWQSLQYDIEQARQKLDELYATQQKMESSGASHTLGSQTQEYQKLTGEVERLQSAMENSASRTQAFQSAMQTAGGAVKTIGGAIGEATGKVGSFISELGRVSFQTFSSGLSTVVDKVKSLASHALKAPTNVKALGTGFKNMVGGLRSFSSQSGQSVLSSNALVRSLTSLKRLLITRIKRTFISAIFSETTSAIHYLAMYSSAFNRTMTSITNNASRLSSNIGVAVGNLVQTLEPAITRIINLLNTAINTVNQLFAALSGKSSYTRAKLPNKDYASNTSEGQALAKARAAAEKERQQNQKKQQAEAKRYADWQKSEAERYAKWQKSQAEKQTKWAQAEAKKKATFEAGQEKKLQAYVAAQQKKAQESGYNLEIPKEYLDPTTGSLEERYAAIQKVIQSSKDAADAQEEWNAELYGFDELNRQQEKDMEDVADAAADFEPETYEPSVYDGEDSEGYTPGEYTPGDIDLAHDAADALRDLENAAVQFEDVAIDLPDWLKNIVDAFKKGDWYGIGENVAKALNNALKKADDWINSVFRPWAVKWAKRIGEAINGFVDNFDWELLGKTVADGLNAIFDAINTFLTKVNWFNLGRGIGRAIKSWFDNIEWDLIGKTFANAFNALVNTIRGIVTTPGIWASIGKALGTMLKNLFRNIKYDEVADTLIAFFRGIPEAIRAFLAQDPFKGIPQKIAAAINRVIHEVDWKDLAQQLANLFLYILDNLRQVLANIDWEGLFEALKIAISTIGKSLIDWFGSIDWGRVGEIFAAGWNALMGTIQRLIGNPAFWTGLGTKLAEFVKGMFAKIDVEKTGLVLVSIINGAINALKTFLANDPFKEIGPKIQNALSNVLKNIDPAALIAAFFLPGLIKAVKSLIASHPILVLATAAILALGPKLGETLQAMVGKIDFEGFGKTLSDALTGALEGLTTMFTNAWEGIKTGAETAWNGIKTTVTTAFEGAKTALSTTAEGIKTGLTTAWNGVKTGAQMAWNGVKTTVTNVFNGAKTALTTTANGIKTALTTAWNGVKTGAQTAWNGLKTNVTTIFNGAKTALTTTANGIKTGLTTAWNGVKTGAQTAWNGLKTTVTNTFNGLKTTLTTTVNGIKTTLTTAWNGIKSGAQTAWNGLKTTVTNAFNGAKTALTTTANGIKTTLSTTWNNVKTTATTAWNGLKTTATTTFTNLKTTITNAATQLKNNLSTAWNGIKTTASTAWDNIKTTATNKFQQLRTSVVSAWNNLKTSLSNVQWSNVGANLVNGLKSGISGAWGGLMNSVKSLVNSLISRVKSFFGVHSPSTVFAEIGEFLDAGLENGLQDGEGKLLRTAAEIANNVTDGMTPDEPHVQMTADGVVSSMQAVISGLSGIAEIFRTIADSLAATGGFRVPQIAEGSVVPYKTRIDDSSSKDDDSDSATVAYLLAILNELQAIARNLQNGDNTSDGVFKIKDFNGRTLFEMVIDENEKAIRRTGMSPLRT